MFNTMAYAQAAFATLVLAIIFVSTSSLPQGGYLVYPQYVQVAVAAPKPRLAEKEQQQNLNKIPGRAGIDYPVHHTIPETSFSCKNVPAHPGIYANVETGCQAYHVCHDGREGEKGASFLCTNGTVFNQKEFNCDWWYNVNCHEAQSHYSLNLDPNKNPYVPKKKPEEAQPQQQQQQQQQAYYF